MIYPKTFEHKIGFDEIRTLLRERCLSTLGKEKIDDMSVSTNPTIINEWLQQVKEFRLLQEQADDFPMQFFFDVRESVARLRLEGTHLNEDELFDLKRSLETIYNIVNYLNRGEDNNDNEPNTYLYPALHRLATDVITFPQLIKRIDNILDKFGRIKDSASAELQNIRQELARTEGGISKTLNRILRSAQSDGVVDKDVTPTMRDGRLVIPVTQGLKRKIKGIVHDESASGKTVFIEPTEVVEANNRIRELESEEHREIIRILTEFSKEIRPHVKSMLESYKFLATIDMIHAKAELARKINGFEPVVGSKPEIDWIQAIHPLLKISLEKQDKKVVPLDITITNDKRILIISGPNAGGKSVCLKTVGLLQYMLQCGLSIPVGERSHTGIFKNILIDIGDEQSIEDDLSTYSSHLTNMKNMMKYADGNTLLLIDEFGTGTEPQIGGAIAEAVLKQFCKKQAYGIITTHYQNLKHFAKEHEGVVNGAMLYDRHQMKALFQLSIGNPGSSFAIEIARKIGLPEDVIAEASEIVGKDYVSMDKYLQDIVRDKQYWEHKRQNAKLMEKRLEELTGRYEKELMEIDRERREVIKKAKGEAEQLIDKANAKIENTIRQIRESQAEKEKTKALREEMRRFKEETGTEKDYDDKVAKKIAKLNDKKKKKRQTEKQAEKQTERPFMPGDAVRLKGESTVGEILSCDDKNAIVAFGMIKTKVNKERLEHASRSQLKKQDTRSVFISPSTMDTVRNKQLNFSREIDIRGMRGDEAIEEVAAFIDTAILSGCNTLRILHGTGNGILQQLVRQYLKKIPAIKSFRDEDIQLGGAGITVIELE